MGDAARPGGARGVHRVDLGSSSKAVTSASGSAVAATTSRSLHESAMRRALPASSTRFGVRAAGRRHDRLADRQRLGQEEARAGRSRVVGGQRREHVLLGLGAESGHVGQPPASTASRSSSREVTPRCS